MNCTQCETGFFPSSTTTCSACDSVTAHCVTCSPDFAGSATCLTCADKFYTPDGA